MPKLPAPPPGAKTRPAANQRSPNRKPRWRSVNPGQSPVRSNQLRHRGLNFVTTAELGGFENRVVEKVAGLVKAEVAGKIEQMLLEKSEQITKALIALSTGKDPHPESVRYALDRILGKPKEQIETKTLNVNITEIEVRLPADGSPSR